MLQELGRWESAEMVRRYAHLPAEHLAPYAHRLCTLEVVDALSVTNRLRAVKRKGLRHRKPLD